MLFYSSICLNCHTTSEPLWTIWKCRFTHKKNNFFLMSLLQVFVHTSVSYVRKPSLRDALLSPTWERFTAFTSSMLIARDVRRSLCVKIVVTPQAALMNTLSMLDNAILEALSSADTTAARPMRPTALHLQIINFISSYHIHLRHTTSRTFKANRDKRNYIYFKWVCNYNIQP